MKRTLRKTERVILEAIYLLSLEGYEATSKGINDLLRGRIEDPKYHSLSKLPVFAYFYGVSRKTIGARIRRLLDSGHLKSYRDPFRKEAYLSLTPLGEEFVPYELPEKAPHLYGAEIRKKGERK